MGKLTDKQAKFVKEYLIDLNATQAAIRAGYSVKNADKIGPELIGKTRIRQVLDEEMGKRSKRTDIKADKVLQELANIAFSNGSDFAKVVTKSYTEPIISEEGNKVGEKEVFYKAVEMYNTDELEPEKLSAIAGIKNTRDGIEIKSHDKLKALELLGKHLGMFVDKTETNLTLEMPAITISK